MVTKPDREDRFSDRLDKRDQRHAFPRDRDRLLYANEFRRLAGVTQVVSPEEGHVFHNRLTHTVKVGQIGRRLAEYLLAQGESNRSKKRAINREGGLHPDVVEAACLAHDIGHPPFGHAAEHELDEASKGKNPEGFEGNAQSFRIVTTLSLRSSAESGLNLTKATLAAVLKYPWKRGENSDYLDKWGYYSSERKYFAWARSGATRHRKTLEASIMDWADDVAYSVHDVDDFYRAGLVPLDVMLRGDSEERDEFLRHIAARRKWKGAKDAPEWGTEYFNSLTKDYAALLAPFRGTDQQYAQLHEFTSAHIRRFLGVELPETVRVAESEAEPPLFVDPNIERQVRLLKELMRYYVFEDPVLVAQQRGQRLVVRTLYNVFFTAALGKTHDGRVDEYEHLIPFRFRREAQETKKSVDEARAARLACDIVSSLSEQHALNLFARVTGSPRSSVFDKAAR